MHEQWLRTAKDIYNFYGLVTPHQNVKMQIRWIQTQ